MAESFVQVPVDGVGKKLRSEELVVGLNTVHQEVVTLADGVTGALASVDAGGNVQIDIAAVSVTVPISAAALPLPAGAATSALQLPNSHDVTIDNAAGAAAVNIQDGGNIISVDGTVAVGPTVTPGTGATDLGKAEDGLHTSGDVGVMALAVRSDVGGPFAADGDYVPLSTDATGALRVTGGGGGVEYAEDTPHVSGDIVKMAGVVQQAADAALSTDGDRSLLQVDATGFLKVNVKAGGGGGTQYAEDTPHVSGDTLTFAGVVQQTADAALSTDGDRSLLQVDATGWLKTDVKVSALPAGAATAANQLPNSHDVTVDNAAGAAAVNIQDGGNIITVDGTVAVSGTVTVDTELPAALALADNDPNPTTSRVGANLLVFDGIAWDRAPGNSADGQLVNLGANNDVTVTGTVSVSGTVTVDTELPAASALADNDPNPTTSRVGANLLVFDGTNWDRAPGTTADGLLVNLGANNDVTVTGSVTVSGTVTADTELPAASALADNDPNPTTSRLGANLLIFDGTNWDRAPGTTADGLLVNLGANNDVTVAGTVAVGPTMVPGTAATNLGKAEDAIHATGDVGVMALAVSNEANTAFAADGDYVPQATDTEGSSRVVGNRDHDAVDAGEVVKVGGVAVSGSATPTSVAAADRTRWIFNQHGIPYVMGGHPNLIVREYDFGAAAQTDVNLAAAVVAADERIYVTRFEALNDISTTAAFVSVRAGFGTVSVPTASATGVSGMIGSHPGLAPGSGIIEGNGAGVIAVGGAGEEPRITTSAATGGNLHVIFAYYLIDETP